MNVNYSIRVIEDPNMPVGYVVMHTGSLSSSDFFPCDGRSLSIASHNVLFNVLGTSYGGTLSTFNLPNFIINFKPACTMCKQPQYNHVPEDGHPFCNSTLDYLEWRYDHKKSLL